MLNDLNLHEVNAEEIMSKHGDFSTVAKLHHRKVQSDIVFGNKLDELLKLEPLQDKLTAFKNSTELTAIQIVGNFKRRLSFFSLYQLFDRVDASEQTQAYTNQLLVQHIKR